MLTSFVNLLMYGFASKSGFIALLTMYSVTVHIQYQDKKGVGIATCSAVYVSPHKVLTAAHCVEEATGKVWARDSDNRSFSAVIVNVDKKADLCLLEVKGPAHPFVTLGSLVNRGDPVFLVASPFDWRNTYAQGFVENIVNDSDHIASILHSASILQGASGSGLFNSRGELVGINTASYHAISNAVDLSEIKPFLTDCVR